MSSAQLPPIRTSFQPLCISFHPRAGSDLVACGLVDGSVEVHRVPVAGDVGGTGGGGASSDSDSDSDADSAAGSGTSGPVATPPTVRLPPSPGVDGPAPSCRAVLWSGGEPRSLSAPPPGGGPSPDGHLFAAYGDGHLSCWDAEGGAPAPLWRIAASSPGEDGVRPGLWRTHRLPGTQLLATGDDAGGVKVWDVRTAGKGSCVMQWDVHTDYVADLSCDGAGRTLLSSSGDCSLCAYDLRRAGTPKGTPSYRRSDDLEDELLSLAVIKDGKKVVCGTAEGALAIFTWNDWDDAADVYAGHPKSIDCLLPLDDDTVLTGSGDGLLRVVQIHPNKLLGVVGDHGGFPLEAMRFGPVGRNIVGTVCHDEVVRLWDVSVLVDDGDDDDDEEEEDDRDGDGAGSSSLPVNVDSDDSDNSVDSDDSGPAPKKRKGKNGPHRIRTDNEKFFQDL